jgi:hypothetical protein
MVDTQKKRFTIPIPPYQPTDDQVLARSDIRATEKAREDQQQRHNASATHTLGEIKAAYGLLALNRGGTRRNRKRKSRKSRRRR